MTPREGVTEAEPGVGATRTCACAAVIGTDGLGPRDVEAAMDLHQQSLGHLTWSWIRGLAPAPRPAVVVEPLPAQTRRYLTRRYG